LLRAMQRALRTSKESLDSSPEPHPARNVPSLRILVAEDNAINQIVSVRMLEKLGYRAVVAANGEDALARLQSEQFGLVLMDVKIPLKDGLTAAREIREQEGTTGKHIPIIAMTAHAMKGDEER